MLCGPCPVHGGVKADSFNLYPEPNEGYVAGGNWKCRSHACHRTFKDSLVGFVWGVLSNRDAGWQHAGDRTVPFGDVVRYLCDFLGVGMNDLRLDAVEAEKRRFAAQMEAVGRVVPVAATGWPRDAVLGRMDCPAEYYLARGYSAETLARYDVGVWRPGGGRATPMAGRVAVPVFDEAYRRVVGVTGRTTHPRCDRCHAYHAQSAGCPREKTGEHAKWFNNDGFRKENHLYNYWFAREEVRRTGVMVLVEGPGDVWRLEEAGVKNAVAMFGNEFSDRQQVVMERSGAMTLVHLPHDDEAGRASRGQVERELGRMFRLHFLELPSKDAGDMTAADLRDAVTPLLRKVGGV